MRRLYARYTRWDWKQRVRRFPALQSVPEDEAIQRLELYTQAERAAMQPWLAIVIGVMTLSVIALLVTLFYLPQLDVDPLFAIVFHATFFTVTLILTRRIRARIKEKIEADVEAGRPLECIACGYDLRGGAVERCPECGAAIGSVPDPRSEPEPETTPASRTLDPEGKLPPKGFGQWS